MVGFDVWIEFVGGVLDGMFGIDDGFVWDVIWRANQGDGVVVFGDIGSAIFMICYVFECQSNGGVCLVDVFLVEGVVVVVVIVLVGCLFDEVVVVVEEVCGVNKF